MSWMYIYRVIHYFVVEGQNDNFHLEINYRRVKMMAASCYFYSEIGSSISIIFCLMQSLLHYMPIVTVQKWENAL